MCFLILSKNHAVRLRDGIAGEWTDCVSFLSRLLLLLVADFCRLIRSSDFFEKNLLRQAANDTIQDDEFCHLEALRHLVFDKDGGLRTLKFT